MKKLIIFGVVAIPVLIIIFALIGQLNRETRLRNLFNAEMTNRTALYDKIWKVISQKGQVAVANKKAGIEAIKEMMAARVDSNNNKIMTFVMEAYPNYDPRERQELYKDLSRAIESNREEFFVQEKRLVDIKLQHDNLITQFPANIFFSMFSRNALEYKPITSDRTDKVMETGKDNNVNVFE